MYQSGSAVPHPAWDMLNSTSVSTCEYITELTLEGKPGWLLPLPISSFSEVSVGGTTPSNKIWNDSWAKSQPVTQLTSQGE